MQWFINLLRGFVTVEVWGAFPERLLNLCAQHRLGFWGLIWVDETTFRFTVPFQEYPRLEKLAQRAMCELRRPHAAGLPALARNLRRRRAFLAGMALSAVALAVLPRFVLLVDVEGNETVPSAVILDALARQGLRPGAYGPALEEKQLSNAVLIELEELSFLSVNLYGCRAEVQVREAEPEPVLPDPSVPADIVSAAAGIVTEVTATSGQALVHKGDTVVEGDILITGFMDLPEKTFSETDMGMYIVRAAGQVWARTWRTMRARIPLTAQVKEPTGRSQTRFALDILGRRVNFYQNSGISYDKYDKMIRTSPVTLPGGVTLPLALIRETVREYAAGTAELDRDKAIVLLEDSLRRDLDEILQTTDGECIRVDYTAAVEGDFLIVTLLAECYEQIGRTVDREGDVGFIPGTG